MMLLDPAPFEYAFYSNSRTFSPSFSFSFFFSFFDDNRYVPKGLSAPLAFLKRRKQDKNIAAD